MAHHLIKATIIPSIVTMIAEKYGVSADVALEMFYLSPAAAALDDDETGLYGQSALYNFSVFEQYL
jgi:hypothetical protein